MASTTGPNLGLNHSWAQGESGWKPGMDANLKKLDAIVMLQVLDKDLNAPPGSPADGDRYIAGPAPTGSWSGFAKYLMVYETASLAWIPYAPKDGWLVWVTDENKLYVYDGGNWTEYARGTASGTTKRVFLPAGQFGSNTTVKTSPLDNGVAEYIAFPGNATTDAVSYFIVPEDYGSIVGWKLVYTMQGTSATTMSIYWGFTPLSNADLIDELAPEANGIANPSAGNGRVSIKSLPTPGGAPSLAAGDIVKVHFHRDDASDANADDMRFIGVIFEYAKA